MRRGIVLVAVIVLAAVSAGGANAAVFARLLRAQAHVGARVPAEVDGWTATHHPPMYLAAAAASTEFTTTKGAPGGWPYIRLRRIQWVEPAGATVNIRFQVPRVKPRRYRLVIYCESCTFGPWGSVIGSANTLRVH